MTRAQLSLLVVLGAIVTAMAVSTLPSPPPESSHLSPLGPDDRVVLLGDSLGVGMAPHLQKLVTGPFSSEAHTGWSASQVLAMLNARPDIGGDAAVLSLGSNDAAGLVNAQAISDLIATLYTRFPRVLWVSPVNFQISPPPAPATDVKQATFRDDMLATGAGVLDPSPAVVAMIGSDHIHLPPKGYALLASEVAARLYS